MKAKLVFICLVVFLVACGGGGSSEPQANNIYSDDENDSADDVNADNETCEIVSTSGSSDNKVAYENDLNAVYLQGGVVGFGKHDNALLRKSIDIRLCKNSDEIRIGNAYLVRSHLPSDEIDTSRVIQFIIELTNVTDDVLCDVAFQYTGKNGTYTFPIAGGSVGSEDGAFTFAVSVQGATDLPTPISYSCIFPNDTVYHAGFVGDRNFEELYNSTSSLTYDEIRVGIRDYEIADFVLPPDEYSVELWESPSSGNQYHNVNVKYVHRNPTRNPLTKNTGIILLDEQRKPLYTDFGEFGTDNGLGGERTITHSLRYTGTASEIIALHRYTPVKTAADP